MKWEEIFYILGGKVFVHADTVTNNESSNIPQSPVLYIATVVI